MFSENMLVIYWLFWKVTVIKALPTRDRKSSKSTLRKHLDLWWTRPRLHAVNVTFWGQGHRKVKGQYIGFTCSNALRVWLDPWLRSHEVKVTFFGQSISIDYKHKNFNRYWPETFKYLWFLQWFSAQCVSVQCVSVQCVSAQCVSVQCVSVQWGVP